MSDSVIKVTTMVSSNNCSSTPPVSGPCTSNANGPSPRVLAKEATAATTRICTSSFRVVNRVAAHTSGTKAKNASGSSLLVMKMKTTTAVANAVCTSSSATVAARRRRGTSMNSGVMSRMPAACLGAAVISCVSASCWLPNTKSAAPVITA